MDSESKLQGSLPNDRPVPVCVVPYGDRDDEISLIDLWRVIVARKMLILLSVLGAILLASLYLFLAEPSYRAEANLLPPQRQDIQALISYRSKANLKIDQYTPGLVYQFFLKNLKSKGLRREYFDAQNLAVHYLGDNLDEAANIDRIFDKKFNQSLRVQADNQDAVFVVASFAYQDPALAAQWLNQFIAFVNERTVRQLVNDTNASILAEIERVRYQLESKLKLAMRKRQDRIVNLNEALRVAKMLGIENASSFPVISENEKTAIEVNTNRSPLYLRGTKALEAEIVVLESRKSEEPFIARLRDIQEKKNFLKSIQIDLDQLSAVTIDTSARVPYRVERPRKKLIFLLAVVVGLVGGIFLVFMAEFLSSVRTNSNRLA